MKAVILAGGEGTRLRPVSSGLPKPMVPLFDRPVLEHIIRLLKKHGITELCLTLRFLPSVIAEYFGDGEDFGVLIEHRIEREPLGTAGSVRACLDFIGDEDFLVISGDAVCDIDLSECIRRHFETKAEATVVLTHSDCPLEYGLTMLSPEGRISGFVEKPGWDRVVTDLVNTGIYILSPSVFRGIKNGENRDFAKDVFPLLLSEGRALFGFVAEGYWRDIGSPESYLQCSLDALSGKLSLDIPGECVNGIYSLSPLPESVCVASPCYIGRNVRIGKKSEIGPGVSVLSGSSIGSGTKISQSVINGAFIGDNAELCGSIVCSGAMIESGAELCFGSVAGAGSRVGVGSCVCENVKIWPKKHVSGGTKLCSDLVSGASYSHPVFGPAGTMGGEYGADITPASALQLGFAAASVSLSLGYGSCGGEAARVCAGAFGSAACAAGARVNMLDCAFPSEAAFAAALFALPLTVFFTAHQSSVEIHFFGSSGQPLTRVQQRKIEAALSCPDGRLPPSSDIGVRTVSSGTADAYIAAAASFSVFHGGRKRDVSVFVPGRGAAVRAAKAALERSGFALSEKGEGIAELLISRDGFELSALDENGDTVSADKMLLVLALLEFENGGGELAVPYNAPAALEILASRFGSRVLRLGRDGEEAERLWNFMPYLRHAPFAAARLCCGMAVRGETLHALSERIPNFSRTSREIRLMRPRAAVMRVMSEFCSETAAEFCAGIKVSGQRGCVSLSPSCRENTVLLSAESENRNKAELLCSEFERLIRSAEKKL